VEVYTTQSNEKKAFGTANRVEAISFLQEIMPQNSPRHNWRVPHKEGHLPTRTSLFCLFSV